MSAKKQLKQYRIEKVNKFIESISNCGRKFFAHKGRVSRFELDDRGFVWYVDGYTQKRIYTHCKWSKWRGFTEGGTLHALIKSLQKYIVTGDIPKLNLGPWPDFLCGGDLWGYGSDMELVRRSARELRLSK